MIIADNANSGSNPESNQEESHHSSEQNIKKVQEANLFSDILSPYTNAPENIKQLFTTT